MTLGDLLEETVHRFGDRELLFTAKSPVRYSEALAKVDGLAGLLADLGAGPLLTTGGLCYDRRHGTWDTAGALTTGETPRAQA